MTLFLFFFLVFLCLVIWCRMFFVYRSFLESSIWKASMHASLHVSNQVRFLLSYCSWVLSCYIYWIQEESHYWIIHCIWHLLFYWNLHHIWVSRLSIKFSTLCSTSRLSLIAFHHLQLLRVLSISIFLLICSHWWSIYNSSQHWCSHSEN